MIFYFYLSVAVLSGAGLTFDVILRYTEKIKSFGLEKKLFKVEGKTIPVEKMLPQNVTMLLVYFLSSGITGIIIDVLGAEWFFSLPCAIFSGFLVCFIVQHSFTLAIKKFKKREMPKGFEASGLEGYIVSPVTVSDYGSVRFEWKGDRYEAPAFSANGTALPEYERVIIIMEENGCYCVEGFAEIYSPLNDDDFDRR